MAGTVQRKSSTKLAGQRQLLSPKQMQKLVKKGETCYLAIVLPNKTAVVGAAQGSPDLEHQGMTQKVKSVVFGSARVVLNTCTLYTGLWFDLYLVVTVAP